MKNYTWNRGLRAWFPRRMSLPSTLLGRLACMALVIFNLMLLVDDANAAATGLNLATQVQGVLLEANGGTHQSTYALGDILFAGATNSLSKLAGNITTTNKFLCQTGTSSVSAAPAWCTLTATDIPNHDAGKITTGTMATARLGSGTADASHYLRGDSTWATIPGALTSEANQTPTGLINSSNTSYTVNQSCVNLYLFKNGLRQFPGAGADYTFSGTTITYGAAPATGDILTYDCEY